MLLKEKFTAELQYPTFNCTRIWKNYLSVFIHSYDKEIIYKYLHMCLTTNKKLFSLNLINSSNCNKCRTNSEETSLHMFYQCDYIKPLFLWILRCISNIHYYAISSHLQILDSFILITHTTIQLRRIYVTSLFTYMS